MLNRRHLLGMGVAGLAAPALWSSEARAQAAWPTRGPVRLVAQFPPGGLVDTVSRLLAPQLAQVTRLHLSNIFAFKHHLAAHRFNQL